MIRILIADDYDPVRRAINALLNLTEGMEVVGQARDGEEAIKLARQLQPEVVIMDILMPKLNGLAACATIIEDLPKVKVVFLSMYGEADLVQKALSIGGMGYVLKQRSARELVEAVQAATKEKIFLSDTLNGLPLPRNGLIH